MSGFQGACSTTTYLSRSTHEMDIAMAGEVADSLNVEKVYKRTCATYLSTLYIVTLEIKGNFTVILLYGCRKLGNI